MAVAQRVMRSNPVEPKRKRCARCSAPVLEVYVGGRWVEVDVAEVAPEERGEFVVAVGYLGETRLLRTPTAEQRSGEALHRPHDLTCEVFRGR